MAQYLAYRIKPSGVISAHYVRNESGLDQLIEAPEMSATGVASTDLRRIIGVSNHLMVTHCVWFSDSCIFEMHEHNEIATRLIGRPTRGTVAIMALDVANAVCSIDPKFVESKLQETAAV